jgi:hypothetical protein
MRRGWQQRQRAGGGEDDSGQQVILGRAACGRARPKFGVQKMQTFLRKAVQCSAFPAATFLRNSMASVSLKAAPRRVAVITFGVGIIGTSAALCEQKAPAGKEGSGTKDEEDVYADISNLQTWDSNWDGRYSQHSSPSLINGVNLFSPGHLSLEPLNQEQCGIWFLSGAI